MKQLLTFLPILILAAFPILYVSGMQSSTAGSMLGILVLFLGLSGSLWKRLMKNK